MRSGQRPGWDEPLIPDLRATSQNGGSARGRVPLAFDTTALPQAARFDAWRAFCEPVIETLPPPDAGGAFAARFDLWPFGRLALARITIAGSWRRTRAQALADGLDHWGVAVLAAGSQRFRTEGKQRVIRGGTPRLWSLAEAIEAEGDGTWLCLLIPRARMPQLAPAFLVDAPRRVPGAMGRLLGGMLGRLPDTLPGMTSAEALQAEAALIGLLNACLLPSQPGARDVRLPIEAARRARVLAIIAQNLDVAELGPDQLCALSSLSRSELYRCFAPFGGVARAIQRERLRHAHATLERTAGTVEVGRIGEALGFPDPSTFTRAFRREFGYTPSELLARREPAEGRLVPGLAAALSFR
jgi:AraC-like DNA-binding protein